MLIPYPAHSITLGVPYWVLAPHGVRMPVLLEGEASGSAALEIVLAR